MAIHIPDKSGFWIAESYPIVRWWGFQMVSKPSKNWSSIWMVSKNRMVGPKFVLTGFKQAIQKLDCKIWIWCFRYLGVLFSDPHLIRTQIIANELYTSQSKLSTIVVSVLMSKFYYVTVFFWKRCFRLFKQILVYFS